MFHGITVFTVLGPINTLLMSIRDLVRYWLQRLQKHSLLLSKTFVLKMSQKKKKKIWRKRTRYLIPEPECHT